METTRSGEVGRRTFVMTSLASGFALAAGPAIAQTAITTDSAGIVAGEVKIGQMPAYRAWPDDKNKHALVLVISEIFGVHEHIKDLCRRLAKTGYAAVAPELFARVGDPSKITDVMELMTKIVAKTPDDGVVKDLDATQDWVKNQGKLEGDKVAMTGFCWGGRQVWLYGASARAPKAGAAWYGPVSNAPGAFMTKSALDVAGKLKSSIIGFYGGLDTHIPVAQVEMMKKELAAAGGKSSIEIYPDAQHGFNADYRPSYNEKDAKDAWQKMLDHFKKNGVA